MPLREFHSLEHGNEQLLEWVMGEAGNRIHGSTRERPLKLFTETEQAMLQPLPAIAPESRMATSNSSTCGRVKLLHPGDETGWTLVG